MKPGLVSIFRRATVMPVAVTLVVGGVANADINWDGDNSVGNMTYNNNWYGDAQPGWGFASGNLVFNYNNATATSIYYDYSGWRDINDIIWEATYSGAVSLDGNGQGINFNQRLENRSSSAQTIGSTMLLSGGKNGAAQIELNPVNGNLTINGTIYNDNSKGYAVYGNNGKTLTLGSALGVGATPTNVGFTVYQNSNVVVNATQTWTGATTINAGTLSIGSGGTTGALDAATAISVASGAKLIVNRSDSYTLSNTLSGAGSLQKDGAGTLTLAAQKSHTGGTIINNGVLDLTGGGGTGGTIRGTVTVNAGGTLRLSTGDATGYGTGSDRLATININGGTLHVNTTGNQTVSNAAITLTGGTISGIAGSNIDLFNNGTSVTTLASATQSTINLPSLNLRQDDTVFSIADGAAANDLLISAAIGNGSTGNHNMIKSGAGTMALSGASTFTGSTGIRDGAVILTGGNNRLPTTASVILGTSTTSGKLVLDGIAQTVASLTTAGTGTANAVVGGNATASTLTVNNSVDVTYAGKLGGLGTNENNLALTKSAAGNLTLSGTNSYTGATTLSGGTLTISGSTNTGAGAVAFNGGTLQIASGGAFTTTGTASPSGTGGGYNVNAGGTLTVGALNLNYALGNQTVDGTLNVTGDFTTSWATTKALSGTGTINTGGYKSRNYSTLNINTALTLNVTGQFNLGDGSGQNGDINQSAGTVNLITSTAGGIRIAHWGSETSNYNLTGGTLNAKNSYFGVGWDGVGILRVSGTGVANLKELKLGANSNNANIFYLGDAFAGNSGGRVNLGANGISKQSASTINLGNGTIGAYADWSSSAAMVLTSNTAFNTLDSVDNTTGRTLTLSGVLSGAGGLTKTGAGTLKITTRGTYTGATAVDGGILELATPDYGRALKTSGITVNSGAMLNINGTNTLYDSGSPNVYIPITVNGGTVALISTAGGSHNHFGALTLNGGTIWGRSTSPYSNQYSSFDADITVGGSATSTIKGDSASFHFGLVNNRTFTVASAGDASGVDLLVSANLGDTGGIIKAGAGTMRLTGSNTYGGNTTINNGVLQVTGYLYNGGFNNTAVITANSGGTLKMGSFAYGTAGGTGQLADYRQRRVLNGGTFEITGGTHSSGNDFTVNATTGGTFRYNPTVVTDTLTLSGNGNTDIQVDGPLTVDALGNISVSENIAGAGSILKTGAQTLTLSGSNTYGGGTTVSAGTLQAGSTGATNGQLTLNGGNLTVSAGVTYNIDGGLTFASNTNATAASASGSATLRGFDVNSADVIVNSGITASIASSLGIDTNTYGFRVDNSGDLTIAGVISGSGNATNAVDAGTMVGTDSTALWKRGSGTLTLTGASDFTAGGSNPAVTSVQAGVLKLSGGNNRLPSGSAVYLGNTANSSGKLALDGVDQTVTGLTNIGAGTGNAVVGASATLSDLIVNNTNHYTFGGTLGGGGANENNLAITKSGAGTLTLNASNTYSGATNVNAGVLNIQHGNALGGTGSGTTVADGAALEMQGNISVGSEALGLSGTGVGNGGALRNISGDNTYGGQVTLNANTRINSDSGTLTLDGTIIHGTGHNLTVGGSGDTVINGFITTTSGSLTKDGSGTLTLKQTNAFVGDTTISAGRLALSGSGSVASSNIINNGNFNVSAVTGGYTLGATQTLSGSGTVTGAVTIAGTLAIGSSPGTMTFEDNLGLAAGSVSNFEINGFGLAEFDLAQAAGIGTQTVTFGGTLNLLFASGFNTNGSVKIFDFDGYSGGFTTVSASGLASGYTASFDATTGIVSVVPEASTTLLFGLGTLGLALRRRRVS